MSRTWERRVRKNTKQVNTLRKKQGATSISQGSQEKVDKFLGRNYLGPAILIVLVGTYAFLNTGTPGFKADTMFWVTMGLYIFMAVLLYFRRPFLAVGKDYVQTRRLTGIKRISASNIQGITVQNGYVVIEQQKGGNWVFTKLLNRYPTDEMTAKLQQFAADHNIAFKQK